MTVSSRVPPHDLRSRVRDAFLFALNRIDPETALQYREHDASQLLEVIRAYRTVPQGLRSIATGAATGECNLDELNLWLADQGVATADEIVLPPELAIESGASQPEDRSRSPLSALSGESARHETTPYQVNIEPLPDRWDELVPELHRRLMGDVTRPPFSAWSLPQPCWNSRWLDAFAVVAAGADDRGAGFVLIPGNDALSRESEDCWRLRLQAARAMQSQRSLPQVCRVQECAPEKSQGYVVLQRSEWASRSLADRIRQAAIPTPRECFELGISLCHILGDLNVAGIHILDLSPAWIAFDWSPGHRLTQLMDPTAVIPGRDLLPECRGGEIDIADFVVNQSPEPSQVWLVGSLVLALLRGTTECLFEPRFPPGIASSLACLAGREELADADHDRIVESLVADLEKRVHQHQQNMDSRAAVDALRWSVAERRSDRFSTMLEFERRLRLAIT